MNLVPRKFFLDDLLDDFEPEINSVSPMKCDIYEKGKDYGIEMDMPGFDKKDITVDMENGYLTITATKENKIEEKDKKYLRKERSYGKYQRQFYMGDIKEEDVKAEFNNGILKITVPKQAEMNTKKKIEIE